MERFTVLATRSIISRLTRMFTCSGVRKFGSAEYGVRAWNIEVTGIAYYQLNFSSSRPYFTWLWAVLGATILISEYCILN